MNRPPKGLRALFVTLLILVSSFAWLLLLAYSPPSLAPSLSLDDVYRLAANGEIRFAKLLDEDAVLLVQKCISQPSDQDPGVFESPLQREGPEQKRSCRPPLRAFQASYPRSDVSTQQLIERMTAGGATVTVDKQVGTAIMKLILTFMYPLLILANLFGIIFMSRGGDSSIADIAGFGKIKRREKKRPSTGVTFADVGGAEEAVAELKEVTDYLKDPKKFEAYGASAPKGVLLFGPPGCGKTLLARAVAGEAGVPFFPVSGAEFIESLVGVGAARVRDLFQQVKEVAPAIVFIDEIDAVGRKRSGEGSTGGEREQTVNQLLVELDGFEVTAGIVLMGATNRPDILDPALLRPGRFDRHVTLEAPDIQGRRKILELHARGKPITEDVDFESLARRTPGFTGADLANVINEGALLAIRQGKAEIDSGDLFEAVQRVLHGPQRRGKLMSPEERRRLAVHETGHAVVASAMGLGAAVQRISIVARGQGIGSSTISEEADRVLLTQAEIKRSLAVTLAGIAAERMVFGESSTTSEDDLIKANSLAREMVGIYGMSKQLRSLRLLSSDKGYLGSEAQVVEAISGQSLAIFDEQVLRLMDEAESAATELLTVNRGKLEEIAAVLSEEETLEGQPLQTLLSAVGAAQPSFVENGSPQRSARRGSPRSHSGPPQA